MSRLINPDRRKLKDLHCKKELKKDDERKSIKLSDGYGLVLEINKSGKYWYYSFRMGRKQLKLNLGTYPSISLKAAREIHEKAWMMVQNGEDPRQGKLTHIQLKRSKLIENKIEREKEKDRISHNFRRIADQWLKNKEPNLSRNTFMNRNALLKNDIYPSLGHKSIKEIRVKDILPVLTEIAERGATFQARRCRETLQQIFNYARALELCENNPAEAIKHIPAILSHKKQHYPYMKFEEMGQLLQRIRDRELAEISQAKPALELLILTAVRPTNVVKAEWNEFLELETDNPRWIIPASKMKGKREHVVPLSEQGVNLVKFIQSQQWSKRWLFPGTKGIGLSKATLSNHLKTMGYSNKSLVPHGFRSTFSTYANECGLWNQDVIEWILAHSDNSSVRSAYNRATYYEDRKRVLQWWSDEIDKLERK